MSESTTAQWRAVYCKPRQEGRAQMHLVNQGYQVFLPQLRSRRRQRGADRTFIEPLFPRYLFVNLSDTQQNWAPIRSTRGVVGLVRIGEHVPTVPDALIQQLKQRSDDLGVIALWDQHEPEINQPVEITAGPFTGYRGIFTERSGQQRALILLEILNAERSIEVPLENVRKI